MPKKVGATCALRARIAGLNLQGRGSKGYFFKEEMIVTIFFLELSFGNFSWVSERTFREFQDLDSKLQADILVADADKTLRVSSPLLLIPSIIFLLSILFL